MVPFHAEAGRKFPIHSPALSGRADQEACSTCMGGAARPLLSRLVVSGTAPLPGGSLGVDIAAATRTRTWLPRRTLSLRRFI